MRNYSVNWGKFLLFRWLFVSWTLQAIHVLDARERVFRVILELIPVLLIIAFIPKDVYAVTLGEYEAKVKKYTKELQDTQNSIKLTEQQIANTKAEINSITKETQDLEEEIDDLKQEIEHAYDLFI